MFAMALSAPSSPERDRSCLASMPAKSRLWTSLSQRGSSQVTLCSPGRWLKSFCVSGSSLRERHQVVTDITSTVSSVYPEAVGVEEEEEAEAEDSSTSPHHHHQRIPWESSAPVGCECLGDCIPGRNSLGMGCGDTAAHG